MRVLTLCFASVFLFFCQNLSAQTARLSIVNQSLSTDTYTFSILISASGDDIYLGNSDFILNFNSAAFDGPSIERLSDGNFRTESNDDLDALFTQRSYSNATALSIAGDRIRINLSGPNPGSLSAFNTGVAKVPAGSSVIFGTFSIMGYQGSGNMDLQWTGSSLVSTILLPSLNEVQLDVTTTAPDEVLPVELLYFKAEALGEKKVQLEWATASETSNAGFEIQYSSDAILWQVIHFAAGQGTTTQTQTYGHIHTEALVGNNYYRLKQLDLDGDYEFSDIQVVGIKGMDPNNVLTITPNPASDTVHLYFDTGDLDASLQIMDLSGKLLANRVLSKHKGWHPIHLGQLPKGIYFLSMITGSQHYLQKVILQ